MTQTNANRHQGGKLRELRQVRLNIILNNEGWVGKRDDSVRGKCEEQWQVCLDNGWEPMANNLGCGLSKFLDEHGDRAFVVQLPHEWTNGRRSKTTDYSFNLNNMTQCNPDSGKERPIRLASVHILQQPP